MRTKKRVLILMLVVSSLLSPLLITSVHASCSTTCNLEADTNVPSSIAVVWVRADGGTLYQFNHTYAFPFNTTHTLEVMNTTLSVPSTGARFAFKQWLVGGSFYASTPIITTPATTVDYTSSSFSGPFEAQFEEQLQLSLSFVDPSGQPVNPPTSVTLMGPSTVTLSVNQYSNQWLAAGVWTVQDATWEGSPGTVLGQPSIDLTQRSITAPISLKAYPATVKLTDNSNQPVSGAMIAVTFANGTSTTLTSDSQGTVNLGRIPIGSYTIDITYQNRDWGSYSIDASAQPVDTVQLGIGGGTSAPVVSAVVLLTIFGLALFLIVLAVRVRKPPPPPMIG